MTDDPRLGKNATEVLANEGKKGGKMEEKLYCLNCDKELPEDNFCSRNALILTDERGQVSEVLGAWCDEKCMAEWLVKNGLRGKLALLTEGKAGKSII